MPLKNSFSPVITFMITPIIFLISPIRVCDYTDYACCFQTHEVFKTS
jgi:hypothetical protein